MLTWTDIRLELQQLWHWIVVFKLEGWVSLGIITLSVVCVTFRLCAWAWGKPSASLTKGPVHPERAERVRLRHPLWWLLDLPALGVAGALVGYGVHDLFSGKTGTLSLMLFAAFVVVVSHSAAFRKYLPHRPLSPEERAALEREWNTTRTPSPEERRRRDKKDDDWVDEMLARNTLNILSRTCQTADRS